MPQFRRLDWPDYSIAKGASVIIGTKKTSQFKDNLGAADMKLTADEIARIAEVTTPQQIYSNWMVQQMNREVDFD